MAAHTLPYLRRFSQSFLLRVAGDVLGQTDETRKTRNGSHTRDSHTVDSALVLSLLALWGVAEVTEASILEGVDEYMLCVDRVVDVRTSREE